MRSAGVLLALLAMAAAARAQEGWVVKASADLILLDKIRGQPAPVSLKVGDSTEFGSLTIKLRSCYSRPPDQPADAAAFVEVSDARGSKDVFHGWLLADAPSVSQLEHPVYDLRLVACR